MSYARLFIKVNDRWRLIGPLLESPHMGAIPADRDHNVLMAA